MTGASVLEYDEGSASQSVTLFQFWDKKIPPAVAKLTDGVASANAAFDYQMFNDSSAAEFIRTTYGSDTLKLYRRCLIPAMRADLFRYCFLANHGGIYIDADYIAMGSLEPVLTESWQGCLYKREKGLANGMMYFRKAKHPLAEKILEVALYNISNRTSNNVWQVTGPFVLQSIQADEANADLFDEIHFMEEPEFALYFKPAPYLEYKGDDSHWLVARQKGLEIFDD